MANIKDIAKKVGMSISTVSYALNNSPKVSDKTREKIMKVAKELNYYPNVFARNLKRRKSNTIGVFLKHVTGPFYHKIVKGIQKEMQFHNYDLIMAIMFDKRESKTVSDFTFQKRIDGGIVLFASKLNDETLDKISNFDTPLILQDINPERVKNLSKYIGVIVIDDFNGGYLAAKHLIDIGCKKIGFVSGVKDSFDNVARFNGFKKALEENNIKYNPEYQINAEYQVEIATEQMNNYIQSGKELPDAYFCANDQMAMGIINSLKNHNIKIPDDIVLMGFDNIIESEYFHPPLTTIGYDGYKLGELAIKWCFEMMDGNFDREKIQTVPVELVIRESTLKK